MLFANVQKKFKVEISTSPSDTMPTIVVITTNGKIMRFNKVENGSYVYDATDDIYKKDNPTLSNQVYNNSLISTVRE